MTGAGPAAAWVAVADAADLPPGACAAASASGADVAVFTLAGGSSGQLTARSWPSQ